MSIEVYTESTCDVCGKIDRRAHAEAFIPAILWSKLSIHTRQEDNGWVNSTYVDLIICPVCKDKIIYLIDSIKEV